jgi:hypothetical protein
VASLLPVKILRNIPKEIPKGQLTSKSTCPVSHNYILAKQHDIFTIQALMTNVLQVWSCHLQLGHLFLMIPNLELLMIKSLSQATTMSSELSI